MTAPFEIEEPEPVEFSGLLRTRCLVCRNGGVLAAPDQVGNAMCGPCRSQEASTAATILRLPAETPVPVPWVPPQDPEPENGSQGAEEDPGFVCPPFGPGVDGQFDPDTNACHSLPGPVGDLMHEAWRSGWLVLVRHSRGKPAGARTISDLWSVRFRRPGWAGYAVRRGDVWTSVGVSGETLTPFLDLGVTELRTWLADPEQAPEWYAKIKKRVADAALAGKQRACPGPGLCDVQGPWVLSGGALLPPIGPDHTHRADGSIKIKVSRTEPKAGL